MRRVDPSPVVALNRAVALGMRDSPAAGLAAIDALLSKGALAAWPTPRAPICSDDSAGSTLRALGPGNR